MLCDKMHDGVQLSIVCIGPSRTDIAVNMPPSPLIRHPLQLTRDADKFSRMIICQDLGEGVTRVVKLYQEVLSRGRSQHVNIG